MASAAGLAMGGLHPVVAIYSTFLNRAFDQVLIDVALHRLPVTFVLDRAGVTGEDGPSHNGMWDLAILGIVPGLRLAAPRDETTLRAELREAVDCSRRPDRVRFPKTALGPDLPALRRAGGVDVLADRRRRRRRRAARLRRRLGGRGSRGGTDGLTRAGNTVRVVDPRWVAPLDPQLLTLAELAGLVVTVEDGVVTGGVGVRLSQLVRTAGLDAATREIGIPDEFLDHGKVPDVRLRIGLTSPDIARRVVGWAAAVRSGSVVHTP